jgi:hypothetical protein
MINLLWLVAIGVALWFESVAGLLVIIAVIMLDAVLELKAQKPSERAPADAEQPRVWCIRCGAPVNALRAHSLLRLGWHPECLAAAGAEVQREREEHHAAQAQVTADRSVVARHAKGVH